MQDMSCGSVCRVAVLWPLAVSYSLGFLPKNYIDHRGTVDDTSVKREWKWKALVDLVGGRMTQEGHPDIPERGPQAPEFVLEDVESLISLSREYGYRPSYSVTIR